jgi:hypothetical protein
MVSIASRVAGLECQRTTFAIILFIVVSIILVGLKYSMSLVNPSFVIAS